MQDLAYKSKSTLITLSVSATVFVILDCVLAYILSSADRRNTCPLRVDHADFLHLRRYRRNHPPERIDHNGQRRLDVCILRSEMEQNSPFGHTFRIQSQRHAPDLFRQSRFCDRQRKTGKSRMRKTFLDFA